MSEQWRDIPRYEGLYQAGDQGNIRSVVRKNTERVQKTILNKGTTGKGRQHVMLSKDGIRQTYTVHKLVLSTWAGAPTMNEVVHHINGVKHDNRLDNLTYRKKEFAQPRGHRVHTAKLTEDNVREIRASKDKQTYLAAIYNVTAATICYVQSHKTWRHVK